MNDCPIIVSNSAKAGGVIWGWGGSVGSRALEGPGEGAEKTLFRYPKITIFVEEASPSFKLVLGLSWNGGDSPMGSLVGERGHLACLSQNRAQGVRRGWVECKRNSDRKGNKPQTKNERRRGKTVTFLMICLGVISFSY